MPPTVDLSNEIALYPAPVSVVGEAAGQQAAAILFATMPEVLRRGRLGEFLDAAGVERETGLTRRQLRHLRETRQIGFYQRGRTILFRTEEVFTYIEAGLVPARPTRAVT